AQYFDEAHARPREAAAAQVLIDRFAAVFSSDLLSMALGPPLGEADAATAAAVCTLVIEHAAEASGALYLNAKPRGVFAGVTFNFDANWLIPGSAKPLSFRLSVWRPPRPRAAKGVDPVEPAVYEAMAEGAFSQFTSKYLATFFPRAESQSSN